MVADGGRPPRLLVICPKTRSFNHSLYMICGQRAAGSVMKVLRGSVIG
jgi:hypothetical protein